MAAPTGSTAMKYATAVRHLRELAEQLTHEARLAQEFGGRPPPVVAAYAFGDVLEAPDRLQRTDVVLVVDRPARELPWGAEPAVVRNLLARHGLDRVPLRWFCRPRDRPVANHRIVRPLRIWSLKGPDEDALDALAARRADLLRAPAPEPAMLAEQLKKEAAASLTQLDELVHGHRGDVHPIAEELFALAWGYTDLRRGLAALRGQAPPPPPAPTTAHAWDTAGYAHLRAAVVRRDSHEVIALVGDEPLAEVGQLAGDGLLAALAQQHPDVRGAAERCADVRSAAERCAGVRGAAERCAQSLRARDWDGDHQLAEELEAALDTGPAPARQAVPIDPGELGDYLEGGSGPPAWRVQLATGRVWPDIDDFASMTGEALPDDWDDPDAWLAVDPQGSRAGYRDMALFTATVANRRLADRLDRALKGSGVFRRFRDVLADHPDERGRWQVFSQERVRGRARSWLAAHGYRPA